MDYWQATIRTWPYSTGAGAAEDKKAIGDEFKTFEFAAQDFKDASAKAELVNSGIRTNPRVWESNIVKVALKRDHL
jgi:hypothetical protein